ncbi:MAG: choice-of-anchor T family protein [Candidatus Poseidoniaceae archaeon]
MKRVILISLLLTCLFTPIHSQAQVSPIGVDIDCDQQTIEINVHPEQNAPVNVNCVVSNTGSLNQKINVDGSVDGNGFSLILSESSFELAAGEDASFIATFSASPRSEVATEDYNITATIESVGQEPILIPIGQLGSSSEASGQVKSMPYSRMTFQVQDKSTVIIDEKIDDDEGFYQVQLTLFNDGNVDDDIVVEIMNLEELSSLGITHSFYSVTPFYFGVDFYREVVTPGSTSNAGFMLFGIDQLPDESFNFEINLRAYSLTDDSAPYIDVTVDAQVSGSASTGGAFGIESVSNDDLQLVGIAGGGLIALIVLLVLISKLTKKAGKQKIAAKEAKRVAKAERKANKAGRKAMKKAGISEEQIEEEFDDDLDFDDLDDLDDDFDFEDL